MAARHLPDDPRDVGPDDLDAYVVSRSWSRETRRTNYAALRSFFRWAVEVGVLEESPAEHLPRVRATDPCPRPTPEVIWQEAKRRACPRTLLILRLAAEAGLRRIEVARVHSDDLVEDLEGWSLLVHGKGGKLRTVPLVSDDLALAIRDAHGYLFPGDDEGHLSPRWVGKLATRALPGVWTLHTLRHRCATKAYGLDSDLLAVQRFLGHSSPATTQRYIPTEASRMRRAASAAA